jgi:hypothetical protein
VGAIGAIKPKSGSCFPDFDAQWQAISRSECPWLWGMQHIIVQVGDSQERARARSASGVARSARMITRI